MKFRKLLYTIAGSLLIGSIYAQDVNFLQPYSATLQLNSALMSVNQDLNVTAGYKTQWASVDDGYVTYRMGAMSPILWSESGKLDVGLLYTGDQAGLYITNDFQLAVSYDLLVEKKHHIALSLQGGYVSSSIDVGSAIFDDQYVAGEYSETNTGSEAIENDKSSYADASFGLLWSYQPDEGQLGAFFGLSGYHFYTPQDNYIANSDAELAARYNFMGGMNYKTDMSLEISPNFISSLQGGSAVSYFGLYGTYHLSIGSSGSNTAMVAESSSDAPQSSGTSSSANSQVTMGVWYNNSAKTVAFLFGLKYDKYALGYSYGFGNGDLRENEAFSMGLHEITLSFMMNRTGKESTSPVSLW